MKLNKGELMVLYMYGDDSLERTVKRIHMAAALSPRQDVKKMLCNLADKLQEAVPDNWYDNGR